MNGSIFDNVFIEVKYLKFHKRPNGVKDSNIYAWRDFDVNGALQISHQLRCAIFVLVVHCRLRPISVALFFVPTVLLHLISVLRLDVYIWKKIDIS